MKTFEEMTMVEVKAKLEELEELKEHLALLKDELIDLGGQELANESIGKEEGRHSALSAFTIAARRVNYMLDDNTSVFKAIGEKAREYERAHEMGLF